MSQLVSIETDKDLVRDLSNNGLINTNPGEYDQYLLRKKQKEDELCTIHNMQEEIHSLKNDLMEIKNLIMRMGCNGK